MLRVNWQDEEIKVRAYTSLTGDFIKLGKTTVYPFTSGGTQGAPFGWSPYYENGGVYTDVSFTVGNGRFSIGNLGTTTHAAGRYGIYKDFPVTPGKYYLIGVEARTTQGRSKTIRYVRFANGSNHSYLKLNQMWTFDDWEPIVVNVANYAGSGTLRVNLMACPYNLDPKGMVTDANWGIQFQNVWINEQDATYPDPTWHEITCDVKKVDIRYGRDKFTQRYNVATASVRVDNKDSYYTYDNGSDDDLRPGRLLRVTMQLPGSSTELPMYYGIIDAFVDTYDIEGNALVELSCLDMSQYLSTSTIPTMSSRDDIIGSGSRFQNILTGVAFLWGKYKYSYTSFSQQAIVASNRTVRDEIGITSDSEGGWFFCDRTGTLQFYGRRWPQFYSKLTTVQAELLATPTRDIPPVDQIPTVANVPVVELRMLASDWTRDRIINDVSIANQDGTAFKYQDFDSQKANGPFTYQRHDFVNDNAGEPTYADQRANDLMAGYSSPIMRVNSVQFKPAVDTFAWCASAFLEELVRVRFQHKTGGWGWAVATHIQGFTHSLSPTTWDMSITLDHPESWNFWQSSEVGWDLATWGGAANYLDPAIGIVSTPDPGPLPTQCVFVFRVRGPNATFATVADQWNGPPNNSWQLTFAPGDNVLYFNTSTNGSDTVYQYIYTADPTGDDQYRALVVNRSAGVALTEYASVDNGASWQQVGTVANFPAGTIFDTNSDLFIGRPQFIGRIYSVELRTGLNPLAGSVVWRFDANDYRGAGTSYVDPRGRTWTISAPNAIHTETDDGAGLWDEFGDEPAYWNSGERWNDPLTIWGPET